MTAVAAVLLLATVVGSGTSPLDGEIGAVERPGSVAGPDRGTPTPGPLAAPGASWVLPGVVPTGLAGQVEVRSAGSDHAIVAGEVVTTSRDVFARRTSRHVPRPMAATASSRGRLAVAEAGGVTFVDGVDSSAAITVVTVDGPWRPHGVPVAWHDDVAVFLGTDGRLGAVAPETGLVWTTDVAIEPDVAGPGRLGGALPSGDRVVVDLGDGTTVSLPTDAPVVLVAEELVLTVAGEVVTGWSTADGTAVEEWRQRIDGSPRGRWQLTADGPVLTTGALADLRDPLTGRRTAVVAGDGTVAVRGGVVEEVSGGVALRRWDGVRGWSRALPDGDVVGLQRIDDDRVAVTTRAERNGEVVVTVVAAADGGVLAEVVPVGHLRGRSPVLVDAVDGLVGVVGGGLVGPAGIGWVDALSGRPARDRADRVLGVDDAGGWRYAGTTADDGDGDGQLVLVRRDGQGVSAVVGGGSPIAVDIDPKGIGIDNPRVEGGTLTFSQLAAGGGIVVVDATTGAAVRVAGVSARRSMDGLQLAVGRRADRRTLHAIDGATGVQRWQAAALGALGASGTDPALVGPVTGPDGDLVVEVGLATARARSLEDGDGRWTTVLPDVVVAAPVLVGDLTVVALADGTVIALDGADGSTAWHADTGAATTLEPWRDGVVVGTAGGEVVRLDAAGQRVGSWASRDGGPVMDLAIEGDVLVVATPTGLVGLDLREEPGG